MFPKIDVISVCVIGGQADKRHSGAGVLALRHAGSSRGRADRRRFVVDVDHIYRHRSVNVDRAVADAVSTLIFESFVIDLGMIDQFVLNDGVIRHTDRRIIVSFVTDTGMIKSFVTNSGMIKSFVTTLG